MAEPTEAEMMADLQAADAAGDSALAQHIAGRIKAARAPAATDPAKHPLLAQAAKLDAQAPTLRSLLPGLWSTFSPSSPERAAENQRAADYQAAVAADPKHPLRAAAAAFDASPMAGLVFAPTGSPVGPQTVKLPPRVPETQAAKTLRAAGVTGLTAGQRAGPASILAQLESSAADTLGGLAPERAASEQSFMRAAQNKGVAPGAALPASTDLQTRLRDLYQDFGPAYGAIKDVPIAPEAVATLPSAASMPGRGVDARTAAGVKAEVENALTVLGIKPPAAPHAHGHGGSVPAAPQGLVDQFGREIPPPPPVPPKATAGDLMKVRENIRENIRAARQSQDFDRLRLLEQAEDTVTGALEKALTPEQAAALQNTDRQYARLMTAANAAPSGQTTFTPGQYLRQVEKSSGRRTFKTGGAGDLQDLGEAARDTFVKAPATGFRGTVLASIPAATRVGGIASRLLNTPSAQRFLFDPRTKTFTPRPPETFMGVPGEALGANTDIQRLIRALRGPRVGLQPAGADEEDRPR